MSQNSVEMNVVETEISELSALSATRTDEAITELNSAQLALIGGGSAGMLLI